MSKIMRRTWFKGTTTGRVFRNCGLVDMDRKRLENLTPRRQRELDNEWQETFRRGVMAPDSEYNPATPGEHDRFIPYDDSPEAEDEWVRRFVASRGKDVRL